MIMSAKKEKDTLYVSLGGEIDHHEAAKVRNQLDVIILDERPDKLIFDFSDVRFMDSSGIGLVLGRYRLVRELGGNTSVIGAREAIAKIFKMSGVDKMLDINK